MKTEILKRPRAWSRPGLHGWLMVAALGACALFAAPQARAVALVDTLAGGPTQANPSTSYGYLNGTTLSAQFNGPAGLALDSTGGALYVADRTNNAIRRISNPGGANSQTSTSLNTNQGISRPVALVLDGADNLYVLNYGNGNNGTVRMFDRDLNPLGVRVANLTNATALALDSATNLYVTFRSNSVLRITGSSTNTVGVITNSGTFLKGIAVLDDGSVALSDAGNHGVWLLNPTNGTKTQLTGFHGAGDAFGAPAFAQFRSPENLAKAGAGYLVIADRGNHRVKVIAPSGAVSLLYGVASNSWASSSYRGWRDGDGCVNTFCAEAREPIGLTVATNGTVYVTEGYYHILRSITDTGLAGPGGALTPVIVTQPQPSQTVNLGGDALFSVGATGDNLTYQWRFNGTNINGATDSAFLQGNVSAENAGLYSVVVANSGGSVTSSNAVLLINVPPAITTQPVSKDVAIGENATFFVLVSGTAPLRYQWRLNGGVIAGATASSYTRVNVQPGDTGSYSVVVTNVVGSVTSSNAVLTVASPPVLIVAPQDQTVALGSNAAFTVSAVGSAPLTYQWQFNGTNLFGATGTNFSVFNARVQDAGNYAVVISNPYGSITSSPAALFVLAPPVISPNSGYFPMGRTITVQSGLPDVFYTMDGTEPTTNSTRVVMNGSEGTLRWINSTNDLTGLRVRAFAGTNATATVRGVPATANSVGVPTGLNPTLQGGLGSTIVVPIVADLRTNDSVKSFIFRVEITPDGGAPMIPEEFTALSVSANDFVPLVTAAQEGAVGNYSIQPYTLGTTRGLAVSAIGTNANIGFQRYGVVAMLAVPIPTNAVIGATYTVSILNSSATADGGQVVVAFPPKPTMTILVTNVSYTVGDAAPGGWYNAGDFGNRYLDNADVNIAFYASTGLRVPYPFSDVHDTLDVWPEDDEGFTGGDAKLGLNDLEVILQRALGLKQNNWLRARDTDGLLTNSPTTLIPGGLPDFGEQVLVGSPWHRHALVAALPVGNATANSYVSVPVYVQVANDATLKGLQFRCLITPENGGPALTTAPVFTPKSGLAQPMQQSFNPGEFACAWTLNIQGGINFAPHSSNYLGIVRFLVPAGAQPGQTYSVAFANADGSPNLSVSYDFESKRASVTVGAPAAPVTDLTSDEWKLHFFGSLTAVNPNGDDDHDGVPNWAEFLAGTSPTDAASHLHFASSESHDTNGQRQVRLNWLTAPGKIYEVLGSSTPGGPGEVLGTLTGDGLYQQFTDSNPGTARFYRLRVQP